VVNQEKAIAQQPSSCSPSSLFKSPGYNPPPTGFMSWNVAVMARPDQRRFYAIAASSSGQAEALHVSYIKKLTGVSPIATELSNQL